MCSVCLSTQGRRAKHHPEHKNSHGSILRWDREVGLGGGWLASHRLRARLSSRARRRPNTQGLHGCPLACETNVHVHTIYHANIPSAGHHAYHCLLASLLCNTMSADAMQIVLQASELTSGTPPATARPAPTRWGARQKSPCPNGGGQPSVSQLRRPSALPAKPLSAAT